MALRHVVMFRFSADATDEQRDALTRGLAGMPAATGAIAEDDYRHGPDLGLNPASFDYVIVADFASEDDYLTYRDHPDHQALIRDLLTPIVTERASVQYAVPT